MARETFWYAVGDYDGEPRYEMDFESRFSAGHELQDMAAEAADDFYANHDGWECAWPATFRLFKSEDGPEIGRCSVECEHEPRFHATLVGPKEGRHA